MSTYIDVIDLPNITNTTQPKTVAAVSFENIRLQIIKNIRENNTSTLRKLIADLTDEQLLQMTSQRHRSLLSEACEFGDLQLIKVLIDRFGDKAAQLATLPDSESNTALHLAARYQSSSSLLMILKLLGNNAATLIGQPNNTGATPLHLAAQHQTAIGFQSLLDVIGNKLTNVIHQINADGKTPLHIAMAYQDAGVVTGIFNKIDKKNIASTINQADKEGHTALHYAALRQPLKLVKWLVHKGANIFTKTKKNETAAEIAQQNDNKNVAAYLQDLANNTSAKIVPRADQYVVIRMWPPKYKKRPTSLAKVIMAKSDADIGHISIAIRDGNKETYISHWPDWPDEDVSKFSNVPGQQCNLREDIASEALIPMKQVVLYGLDVAKMLQCSKELEKKARWHWTGSVGILKKMSNNPSYNCSGYVYEILKAGGVFEQLLTKKDKLFGLLTPNAVTHLAQKAKAVELEQCPETTGFFENNLNDFKNNLLAAAKKGLEAVNKFLEKNPDQYFLYAKTYAKEMETVLKEVNQHVKQHASAELLAHIKRIVEKTGENPAQINSVILLDIEKFIKKQADLSVTDERGYNALHCAIENGNVNCVKKLLELFPGAINNMSAAGKHPVGVLDLAIKTGNKAMIELLKENGAQTTTSAGTDDKADVLQKKIG